MTEVTSKVRCLTIVSRSSYVSKVYFDKKADESMMRVLIIITTSFAPWDGLTTVAMNYYRRMDKSGLQINFASCNEAPQSLVDELKQNSSQYIQLPDRKKKTLGYMKALYLLLKKGKYDVVHIHGNSATMTFDLVPSLLAEVKRRIVHVHNTKNQHPFLHTVLQPVFNRMAAERIAVSEVSGRCLYKKNKFIVLNNAIDTERYRFNVESRIECRKEYGFDKDTYVVGTVGRINAQKNHSYLVDIFAEMLKIRPDAKLLIVGDGELKDKLTEQIRMLHIEGSCILAGMQWDTAGFLSAMDVFVFPSLYEGLPLALVEAQASGLSCIVSDAVSMEANVSGDIEYMSLCQSPGKWAGKIVSLDIGDRSIKSEEACRSIADRGYDIELEADRLRMIYLGEGIF